MRQSTAPMSSNHAPTASANASTTRPRAPHSSTHGPMPMGTMKSGEGDRLEIVHFVGGG